MQLDDPLNLALIAVAEGVTCGALGRALLERGDTVLDPHLITAAIVTSIGRTAGAIAATEYREHKSLEMAIEIRDRASQGFDLWAVILDDSEKEVVRLSQAEPQNIVEFPGGENRV